jgi:hypothetical protein
MEESVEQPSKQKVYEAPKLVRYGDLVEVTRGLNVAGGKNDNAMSSLKT